MLSGTRSYLWSLVGSKPLVCKGGFEDDEDLGCARPDGGSCPGRGVHELSDRWGIEQRYEFVVIANVCCLRGDGQQAGYQFIGGGYFFAQCCRQSKEVDDVNQLGDAAGPVDCTSGSGSCRDAAGD